METGKCQINKIIRFLSNIRDVTYYKELRTRMNLYISWLKNVNSDSELYCIQHMEYIIDAKNFFKYPSVYLSEFIDTYDDWMKMRYSLAREYESKETHLNLEKYCQQFVLYLELLLRIMYKKLLENTIEKQLIINRLLQNKRCFDLRNEIKMYLFDDASIVYDRLFNEIKSN